MENKIIVGIGGATASFLWGSWDALLTTLAVFVGIDYLTGLAAAIKEKRVSSDVGFWGIPRKVFIFALVTIAHNLDLHLPSILPIFQEGQHVLRDGVILFYLANEGVSILENAGRLGVPIPEIIHQALKQLQEKGKGENDR